MSTRPCNDCIHADAPSGAEPCASCREDTSREGGRNMSNRNFSSCQQRPSAQTGPKAQHCRAGLPSQDAPTSRPCLRRAQCALHQRYLADLDLPDGLLPGVRVLIHPWVEGCACHYFTPSV